MGPTVLLAIWERSLLNGMNAKLQNLHFDVVVAENEVRFAQQTTARNIDVILLDIRSNGENSLRLMAYVKEKKPETEVILLSNQKSISLAMEGIQAGAFDDIPEPFDVDEITRKIRAAWKRKNKLRKKERSRLVQFWEKTMMAVTYAEAGDFETALRLAGKEKKGDKKSE
ncbi:MAG: response regulator [Desulfobulbaceae bacterium]|nr:response regulator [Desulfobulbaceae bacterium]